eukprot:6208204-Pleurochrysis_carterae.AAC.2
MLLECHKYTCAVRSPAAVTISLRPCDKRLLCALITATSTGGKSAAQLRSASGARVCVLPGSALQPAASAPASESRTLFGEFSELPTFCWPPRVPNRSSELTVLHACTVVGSSC